MSDWYDPDGNPISVAEWERLRSDGTWEAAMLKTDATPETQVSTVPLGLDHSFGDDGPPLIWETMVFGGRLDQQCTRYPTRELAYAGHDETVAQVRAEAQAFEQLAKNPRIVEAVTRIEAVLVAHNRAHQVTLDDADLRFVRGGLYQALAEKVIAQ